MKICQLRNYTFQLENKDLSKMLLCNSPQDIKTRGGDGGKKRKKSFHNLNFVLTSLSRKKSRALFLRKGKGGKKGVFFGGERTGRGLLCPPSCLRVASGNKNLIPKKARSRLPFSSLSSLFLSPPPKPLPLPPPHSCDYDTGGGMDDRGCQVLKRLV